MSAVLYYTPFMPAFNSSGLPVAAARLYFTYSGGVIPAPIYSNSGLSIPLTNPVVADGAGRFPNIYLDNAITYRVRITDKLGVSLTSDADPYIPGGNIVTGPTGPTGAAGPAFATYTTLATFKAASIANKTQVLQDPTIAFGLFYWRTAEAPYVADNVNIVKADSTALSVGAWVRESGSSSSSSVSRQYPRPKKWAVPTDMNNPLKLWIDSNGKNFALNKSAYTLTDWVTAETASINHYYLDYVNGNNANTGLAPGAGGAWQTFDYFIANCVSPAVLHCMDTRVGYLSSTAGGPNFGTKKIKIIGENPNGPTLFSGWRETYDLAFLALVADAPAYKTTAAINHATLQACFDNNYKDRYGLPLEMPHVASLALCKTTPGSWFTDGTTTAWHMIDGRQPDPANGLIPVTSFSSMQVTTDGSFSVENCSFAYNGGAAATSAFRIRPNTLGAANTQRLALKEVRCFGASGNAFELYDFLIMALENCYGAACFYDIFNYKSFIASGTQGQWITVYEENCYGRDAGYLWRQNPPGSNSNNLSTGHSGVHVIRVNTAGHNIPNSFIADVQGCYSLNYGISPTQSTASAYANNYWYQKLFGEGSTGSRMIIIGSSGDALDAAKVHFSNSDDLELNPSLGEIYIADWLGPTTLEKRSGTILKNYETGAAL